MAEKNYVERFPPQSGRVAREGQTQDQAEANPFNIADFCQPPGGANISLELADALDHTLPNTPCKVAYIQNDWDSAGKVAVGLASNPTAKLERGQWAQPIFVDNLNKIHVKAAATGTIVGYYQV